MVFGKILGLLDLAVLACITLVFLDYSPGKILIWAIFYLVIKGIIFRWDFNSWLDMSIAVYALMLILGLKLGIVYVFVLLYMGQKGLLSLV